MRSRNLKPGFFKNEELAELPALTRILFEGLWCMADREGRLEDRPKRIKAEVLPYDDCDIEGMLDSLANRADPFIIRYSVNGCSIIAIPTFLEHQAPHYKEAPSELPPFTGELNHRSIIGQSSVNPDTLIPDSGFLIPSSLIPDSNASLSLDCDLIDDLMSLAGEVKSAVATWVPGKKDHELFQILLKQFPPAQIKRELQKFQVYAPQREYRAFTRTFASWMNRITPEPFPEKTLTPRELRIQTAKAQLEATGDRDLARTLCWPEEWAEVLGDEPPITPEDVPMPDEMKRAMASVGRPV
jgi:hypothetical protein